MKKIIFIVKCVVFIAILALCGCAVSKAGMSKNPDYTNLNYPDYFDAHKKFNIALGSIALKPIRWAINQSDMQNDELDVELIKHLNGLNIRIYDNIK